MHSCASIISISILFDQCWKVALHDAIAHRRMLLDIMCGVNVQPGPGPNLTGGGFGRCWYRRRAPRHRGAVWSGGRRLTSGGATSSCPGTSGPWHVHRGRWTSSCRAGARLEGSTKRAIGIGPGSCSSSCWRALFSRCWAGGHADVGWRGACFWAGGSCQQRIRCLWTLLLQIDSVCCLLLQGMFGQFSGRMASLICISGAYCAPASTVFADAHKMNVNASRQ